MRSVLLNDRAAVPATAPAALDVYELFDLDTVVSDVHDLPAGMDSEDCTSDTCTNSCVGCGG